ncbi:type II toxin-antitoxin system PrlF family antitoxin [Henriciella sp. AS95]|uniref:type II toxin-antitoxin system PrlF family antitoxin n=1 Tax=Henriciella sp. AS95 TaxID=3135782 RepID=UPI00316BDF6F
MQTALQASSKLTDRYQTTVPAEVRSALNLGKQDRLKYNISANGDVVLQKDNGDEEDPAMVAFLSFLARDMEANPQRVEPLGAEFMARVASLTQDVEIDLDAPLSPDDE